MFGGSLEGRTRSVDNWVEQGSAAGVAVTLRDAGGSSEGSE